jgi:hypothetical protein
MAKDDYDVIVFKILTYLYACIKRKIAFEDITFMKTISFENISEEYLMDVLDMMQDEGLITGYTSIKAWGGNLIRTSELSDLKITSKGIRYLNDNSKMKEVKNHLAENIGLVAELIKLAFM